MADGDFVGVDVRGMEAVTNLIRKLPREAQDTISEDVAKVMLNIEKTYPSYRYVSRRQAYPPSGWQSDKQRRYVMARIREGSINPGSPNRTQAFRNGWRIEDKGVNAFLVNEVPYGIHLKDPRANHMKLIGWSTIAEDIDKHQTRIMRTANAGAQKAIRKLGG